MNKEISAVDAKKKGANAGKVNDIGEVGSSKNPASSNNIRGDIMGIMKDKAPQPVPKKGV